MSRQFSKKDIWRLQKDTWKWNDIMRFSSDSNMSRKSWFRLGLDPHDSPSVLVLTWSPRPPVLVSTPPGLGLHGPRSWSPRPPVLVSMPPSLGLNAPRSWPWLGLDTPGLGLHAPWSWFPCPPVLVLNQTPYTINSIWTWTPPWRSLLQPC